MLVLPQHSGPDAIVVPLRGSWLFTGVLSVFPSHPTEAENRDHVWGHFCAPRPGTAGTRHVSEIHLCWK